VGHGLEIAASIPAVNATRIGLLRAGNTETSKARWGNARDNRSEAESVLTGRCFHSRRLKARRDARRNTRLPRKRDATTNKNSEMIGLLSAFISDLQSAAAAMRRQAWRISGLLCT